MKFKKFILLLFVVIFSLTLFGCDLFGGSDSSTDDSKQDSANSGNSGSNNSGSGNSGYSDSGYTEGNGNSGPVSRTWTAGTDSTVHIVKGGLDPSTQTVSFSFGLDTISLKKSGYTTLNFELSFTVRLDAGIVGNTTTSDVDIYFKDGNSTQIGAGWSGQHFTSSSGRSSYTLSKSISIDRLQQNKGVLYLTFDAVSNTFQTGTYISGISVTVTAE